jgi:NAD(P)-dependent dehydrogenase (short-subunit alcohol dehydrogenase family)
MTTDLFSVAGRTALVTGGSRGIGLMIAAGLVSAGAEVIICSRKAAACAAAAAELSASGSCWGIGADLSTQGGVRALAETVRERMPVLDILVNNAGATWGAPLEDYPDQAWDRVLNTNLRGPFQLTVELLGPLRAAVASRGTARVINIGSVDGLSVPTAENFAYSASKAAVHMTTRHLASALVKDGITVNAIAPGPFESKMMAYALDDPDVRADIEGGVPMGRIGTPDDIVGATIFLASRAGAYLTGAVIPVDGGLVGCS